VPKPYSDLEVDRCDGLGEEALGISDIDPLSSGSASVELDFPARDSIRFMKVLERDINFFDGDFFGDESTELELMLELRRPPNL